MDSSLLVQARKIIVVLFRKYIQRFLLLGYYYYSSLPFLVNLKRRCSANCETWLAWTRSISRKQKWANLYCALRQIEFVCQFPASNFWNVVLSIELFFQHFDLVSRKGGSIATNRRIWNWNSDTFTYKLTFLLLKNVKANKFAKI